MSTEALRHGDGRAGSGTDRLELERLTPLDLSTLRIERRGLPLNVAALAILEPGGLLDASQQLVLDAIRARIEHRLHLAPRLRQRLYRPGFGFGAPVWVDDASFDTSRHVRARMVPAPGDEAKLLATCVELNGRPFDQAHPLWEIWFLTGGLDGNVSMLVRFHHVLADGLAALVLLGVLFDSEPEAAPQPGNLVGVLLVPLPVGETDPIRRLEQIARATAKRKRLPPYQPCARLLQRWMIRSMNRQRRINLLMSNLPGPPQPMYFAGTKILEIFQIGVIQGNVPVQIGVLSYAGQLNLDIAGDAAVVPDLDAFARGMADDLERLGARSPGEGISAGVA